VVTTLALTKAEHDAIVARRRRPVTDGPIQRRPQSIPAATPDTPTKGAT
jgi:hypothetical protein